MEVKEEVCGETFLFLFLRLNECSLSPVSQALGSCAQSKQSGQLLHFLELQAKKSSKKVKPGWLF